MVSIKDISRRAGVSVSTVSKALNGNADVGAETGERVRRLAKEMGYLPNAAARSLKTNRSRNLGVLFVDKTGGGLAHEYFSSVLNSVMVAAEAGGYDITFVNRDTARSGMSYLERCRYRGCDGVVIASADFTDPASLELVSSDLPVVTIDHAFDHRISVLSDNAGGMRELVSYISGLGHRRLAFIHGEDTSVTQKRLGSFHRTCRELGIDVPDGWTLSAAYHDPNSVAGPTRALLTAEDRPTCILYPDDYSLIGGLGVIEELGLCVPGDVSVAGYDGIYLSQILRPRLTTLRQDTQTLGRTAAEHLIELIERPKLSIPQQISVPGMLLPGESVRRVCADFGRPCGAKI